MNQAAEFDKRQIGILPAIFMAAMYLYVLLKAWYVPITYDEAYTIEHYATMSFGDIMFAPEAFNLANNHVLNTLLTRCMLFFTAHPFGLRLPNVLAYSLFLYSAFKISRNWFDNRLLQLLCLMAIALNPMLSEFFALCRGYGLGIAFQLFALLQLTNMISEPPRQSTANTHRCLLAVLLSVYSSFSLLLPALCIIALVVFLRYYLCSGKAFFPRLFHAVIVPVVYSLVLLGLVYWPLNYLVSANALFHGGTRNFIADTWTSMISDLLGLRPRDFAAFDEGNYDSPALRFWVPASLLFLAVCLLTAIGHVLFSFRKSLVILIPLFVLGGSILGINLQFYLMGTKLVNYRVALYLYPLLILLFFSILSSWQAVRRKAVLIMAVVVTGGLLVNFIMQLKVTYTTEWPFDAYSDDVCKTIVTEGTAAKHLPATVHTHQLLMPAFNFYITHNYPGQILPVVYGDSLFRAVPDHYDFVYLPKAYVQQMSPGYKIIKAYEDSTYLLFRKE